MSFINQTNQTPSRDKTAHSNWMGGPSWDITDPLFRLRLAASSCFFGEPQYYHEDKTDSRRTPRPRFGSASSLSGVQLTYLRDTLDALDPQSWRGMSPAELLESAIDAALDQDPEGTLKIAVALRNEDHIRVTPQVILVRAANHKSVKGTGLVRRYAVEIIKRADEPATGLAYQLGKYGKPIPDQLKKSWSDALQRQTEYGLAKYKLADRTVKTVDVGNLTHPASAGVDKLMRGDLKLTEGWEAVISAKGSNTETWTEVLPFMTKPQGHMALLRNVRNLVKNNVDPGLWTDALLAGVEDGQQLPFRYFSAYKANESSAPPQVLDALEECLFKSIESGSAPHFAGRTMSLCDNSGSAWGTLTSKMGTMHVAEIANLTAILTGHLSDEGHVGVFGDGLETFAVRKRSSVFDQTKKAHNLGQHIGQGTENGIWLFWDQAIREEQHWDNVFVYSDMQAGHGGLYGTDSSRYRDYVWGGDRGRGYGTQYIDVPKLIQSYRSKVNPNVNVFLVQVAGYQDTIVPEFYRNTYILGGWGEGIWRFAAEMAKLTPSQ